MSGIVIAQEKIELYPGGVINHKAGIELGENVTEFYSYQPAKVSSDIAFLIIPGGGYGKVAIQHEGHDVAKRLQDLGYASFVLRYRLPKADQQEDKRIAPIQDAQSALAYIRAHAEELGNIRYVGVIGFSAGGHLASTLSTHFMTDYRTGAPAKMNLRPDFSILAYPVISMDDKITHMGSKKNLIGPDFLEDDVRRFSNELNINSHTPPAFLIHAADDKAVPIANSERYLNKLKSSGVAAALFRYETGGHGFGLNNKTDNHNWFNAMLVWVNDLPLGEY
ncbi:alpha/beta hydrolase [Sphingobacterium sp. SGG-5]|uniref:alpha/beta hydrolase n=1 Tax=Sphingobacterium sp. SGG-5 TaxID=2710881 RepID=UPI001F0D9B85|nr:alpha/beta hydrolase [Sphingobacterium sp. SGG-5]